jgi:uncharacterized membrane protein YeaQ/YmgE (transglycosylase-associated protein family)
MKRKTQTPLAYHVFLSLSILVFSIIFGLFIRDDHGSGLRISSLFAACLGSTLMLILLRLILEQEYFSKKILTAITFLFVICILFSMQTALFNHANIYATSEIFWFEVQKCFFKGCLSTFLVGLVLSIFSFKFSAWPSRSGRLLLSSVAGLAGAYMLEIHCDSSFIPHVLLGHLAQGMISGLGIFFWMEVLFVWHVKKSFPELKSLKAINKLG